MAISTDTGLTTIKVTGTTDTSAKVTDKLTRIKSVYWSNPTTAAHLLNITDKNGGPIIDMYCWQAHEGQQWIIEQSFDGIYIADMDSGTLYIYR